MDWDDTGGILVKTICRCNKSTTLEERITSLHLFEVSLGIYAEFMLCTTMAPILIELLASCVRDSCGYVKLAAMVDEGIVNTVGIISHYFKGCFDLGLDFFVIGDVVQ